MSKTKRNLRALQERLHDFRCESPGLSLPAEIVRLHWFQRDSRTGATTVTTAALDENGAFGDWPEDFDDVILSTEKQYLDAVESRIAG